MAVHEPHVERNGVACETPEDGSALQILLHMSDEIAAILDVEDAVVLVDVNLKALTAFSERLLLLARVNKPAGQQPRHAIWIPLVLNIALFVGVQM